MESLKYYTVILDGIDKAGKDTIAKYVWRLDKRLNVICRGWPSLVVYANKYDRKCTYERPYKNALYVHVLVDKEDWEIRCDITNEAKIDYDTDKASFLNAFSELSDMGYKVATVNTSYQTAYYIAKCIVLEITKLNKGE